MKNLYMIRLENGNSVIVQAESQDTALEHAGLRVDPAAQAAARGERMSPAYTSPWYMKVSALRTTRFGSWTTSYVWPTWKMTEISISRLKVARAATNFT
jgi:hypothetical protein